MRAQLISTLGKSLGTFTFEVTKAPPEIVEVIQIDGARSLFQHRERVFGDLHRYHEIAFTLTIRQNATATQ